MPRPGPGEHIYDPTLEWGYEALTRGAFCLRALVLSVERGDATIPIEPQAWENTMTVVEWMLAQHVAGSLYTEPPITQEHLDRAPLRATDPGSRWRSGRDDGPAAASSSLEGGKFYGRKFCAPSEAPWAPRRCRCGPSSWAIGRPDAAVQVGHAGKARGASRLRATLRLGHPGPL
jgi:hypothetical protein